MDDAGGSFLHDDVRSSRSKAAFQWLDNSKISESLYPRVVVAVPSSPTEICIVSGWLRLPSKRAGGDTRISSPLSKSF